MLSTIVLVKEKDRQFHDPEVDEQVPEDDGVIRHENFLSQNCVTLLRQSVDKLLIQGARWEQVHRESFSAINVGSLILTLHGEFRDEALLAEWALYCVVRLILREQTEELLFPQWFLAVLTLFLQLDIQAALKHLAQLHDSVLGLHHVV